MSTNIVVPEVGESIVDARVAKWLKHEGDAVAAGEALVELETDKVDVEVAAPKAGVLKTIAHKDGADVKIGDVLGTIDERAREDAEATGKRPRRRSRGRSPTAARPRRRRRRHLLHESWRARRTFPSRQCKSDGPRVTRADVEKSAPAPKLRALQAPSPSEASVRQPPAPRSANRGTHPHVQAARDHREAARRSAADRGHAHDVQRSGHVRRDDAARAPEGSVQGAARRAARHRVVLREGRRRRAQGVPASQRRDPGRRDGAQALLRHRRRGRRGRRASWCRSCATPTA